MLVLLDSFVEEIPVTRQPRMIHDMLNPTSLLGVGDEHDLQQVFGLRGHVVWEVKPGIHDVLVEKVDVVSIGIGGIVIIW